MPTNTHTQRARVNTPRGCRRTHTHAHNALVRKTGDLMWKLSLIATSMLGQFLGISWRRIHWIQSELIKIRHWKIHWASWIKKLKWTSKWISAYESNNVGTTNKKPNSLGLLQILTVIAILFTHSQIISQLEEKLLAAGAREVYQYCYSQWHEQQ